MSFKLHVLASDGTVLADGLAVDAMPSIVAIVNPITGLTTYLRIARTVAPISTAAGSTVRVYTEPTDPPPPKS